MGEPEQGPLLPDRYGMDFEHEHRRGRIFRVPGTRNGALRWENYDVILHNDRTGVAACWPDFPSYAEAKAFALAWTERAECPNTSIIPLT